MTFIADLADFIYVEPRAWISRRRLMTFHTIIDMSYLIVGMLVVIAAKSKRRQRTTEFETGMGAGLGVAGLLSLAAPWLTGLP